MHMSTYKESYLSSVGDKRLSKPENDQHPSGEKRLKESSEP